MSTKSLTHRIATVGSFRTRVALLAAFALVVSVGFFATRGSKAASPMAGMLGPTVGTSQSWGGTAIGGTAPNGEGTCVEGVSCDTYRLTTLPGVWTNLMIFIRITWIAPAHDYDLYVHKCPSSGSTIAQCNAGPLIQSSGGGAPGTSEQVTILPSSSGTGDYTVHVVYFTVAPGGADQYQGTATVLATSPRPAPQDPGPAAGYTNYPATDPLGKDSGEPSIGANWKTEVLTPGPGQAIGGTVMFQAGLETLQVKFSTSTTPATATWTDVSPLNTSVASLDPILFTDHQGTAGRTFVSQLTGQDSASAYSDTDGDPPATAWTPSQGGGIPSGVDHQTIGAGRYAGDLSLIPHPVYPNAVYYCSQDLVTAFCARSDNGGLTYGAGVPTYSSQCGGIHGHVKVSPKDGTIYVPNHTCSLNQGVALSEDNGITWTIRRVVAGDGNTIAANSSPADWDPSVGIGALGTVYFGYKNGDGTAHMAVSIDHGKTWVRDYDVGASLGVTQIAFPAVVAGDDNRAAFAFLGTTGIGGPTAQVWHVYVAHTYDRGASYITTDVTPFDPVQIGTICSAGLSCGSDRNLLDFIDATVDKEGRVLVGYADGCLSGCTNQAASQSALATIARQCSGRGLFAANAVFPASDCGGGPDPTPTPTPTPEDSCDGINVVTDPAGDATNPAPGGQPPTDQADITAVSFSADALNLTTTMNISNLNPTGILGTPSPGTTFTTYYVIWTSSNGTLYATQVDKDVATTAYGWGPFDTGTNQITTYTATTGTFNVMANTITVLVPRAGIGSPVIPVPPNDGPPAVTNPYALTFGGVGVLGSGLVFTRPMDRAPNSGFGKRWAVCP